MILLNYIEDISNYGKCREMKSRYRGTCAQNQNIVCLFFMLSFFPVQSETDILCFDFGCQNTRVLRLTLKFLKISRNNYVETLEELREGDDLINLRYFISYANFEIFKK